MSCGACNCEECEEDRARDRAMNRSNVMDDEPGHRPTWRDAEPANEVQAKRWGEIINETLDTHKSINMYATISIVLSRCHVRNENYDRVGLQVERFIRESPMFELRKGKNGGVFRKELDDTRKELDAIRNNPITYTKLIEMAGVPDLITGQVKDNYTCKGCGNTKLHDTNDKSCWSCGRPVGT